MNRRDFLRISGPLSTTPLLINAIPLSAFNPYDMLMALDCDTVSERALIIIKMDGGNDGINTVIPIPQYDLYARQRPSIKIPEQGSGKYILLDQKLRSADQVALHPSLKEIKSLYDQGFVNIVQGAGYPSPNRSHF
ncbi:MAG: DUF1501 domain-containing protein [Bacteroidia bacterium]|nr:DUF1501 domain-containing protein [Bacteroidia bacterium]